LLREFGLEKLAFGASEEVGPGSGDGGDQMVDCDGLAVERALFVGKGGELNRLNRTGLFGDDGPEVAVILGDGESQKRFQCAGVEVGQEDGGGMPGQSSGGAASVGGDVEQDLRGVWRGDDADSRAVDGGAQLNVLELVALGELLGFGDVVVESLKIDADKRGGAIALRVGGKGTGGGADGFTVLGDDEAGGLCAGSRRRGEERREGNSGEIAHPYLHVPEGLDTESRRMLQEELTLARATQFHSFTVYRGGGGL